MLNIFAGRFPTVSFTLKTSYPLGIPKARKRRIDVQTFGDQPILLAPGPVPLSQEVLTALALPMIHHRTDEFSQILESCLQRLKWVFQTEQPVLILPSTGSGGMEALLINVLSPGDEVLAIISGKFGERWAEMAETFGYKVSTYNVPWGEAAEPKKLEQLLKENPQFKAVIGQVCETSTATLHPIKQLAQTVQQHSKALFLVDAITGVGATQLLMDQWGIDGVVAGSQKAFKLPTGLAMLALSDRAWQAYKTSTTPKFAFDLGKELKANQKSTTFFSSSVTLIRALDVALNSFVGDGLNQSIQRCEQLAKVTREHFETLGLTTYSKSSAPSVTALNLPEAIDGKKFKSDLETKYGVTLGGGQDQLAGKIIRIGHLGEITNDLYTEGLRRIHQAMRDYGIFSKDIDSERHIQSSIAKL